VIATTYKYKYDYIVAVYKQLHIKLYDDLKKLLIYQTVQRLLIDY